MAIFYAHPSNEEIVCNTSEYMVNSRTDRLFCDVVLKSGEYEVYAHRLVLATLSNYFIISFMTDEKLNRQTIELDTNIISEQSLESIVDYAYTGNIQILDSNVFQLLIASDYFDIKFINEICKDHLKELIKNKKIKSFINLNNLKSVVWFVSHFNLKFLLPSICAIISKRFMELSRRKMFRSFSPHCLLMILSEKELIVCDYDIPIENGELELFKTVVDFILENNISEDLQSALLDRIDFSEIPHNVISRIIESIKSSKSNFISKHTSVLSHVSCVFKITQRKRNFNRTWKYIDGINEKVDIDDKVCNIKVFQCTGIVCLNTHSLNDGDIKKFICTVGLKLTYKSGRVINIDNVSGVPLLPFDRITTDEISLKHNEVIVQISSSMENLYEDVATLKFITNLGNKFYLTGDRKAHFQKHFFPKTKFGYFYSFEKNCTVDDLQPLWVEYENPRSVKNTTFDNWRDRKWRQIGFSDQSHFESWYLSFSSNSRCFEDDNTEDTDSGDGIIVNGETYYHTKIYSPSDTDTNKTNYDRTRDLYHLLVKAQKYRLLCDIILKSGKQKIYAHRIILVRLSDFFKILFKYEGGFNRPVVEFDDNLIPGEYLCNLVNYAYTGYFSITKSNVCDYIIAADYLNILFIKRSCEDYLRVCFQEDTTIIAVNHLLSFTFLIFHYELQSLVDPLCVFLAEDFVRYSSVNLFETLSFYSLLQLLNREEFIVCDRGIPVENTEKELLKVALQYINENKLSEKEILQLLQTINFKSMNFEQISSVVESCCKRRKKYLLCRIFVIRNNRNRVRRKTWEQYLKTHDWDGEIKIDDRVCKVELFFQFLNHNVEFENQTGVSILELAITYKSGKVIRKCKNQRLSSLPFNKVICKEFTLSENEAIIKFSRSSNVLTAVKFITNFGNIFSFGFDSNTDYWDIHNFSAGYLEYFHSFESNCSFDHLKPSWVTYHAPKTWVRSIRCSYEDDESDGD